MSLILSFETSGRESRAKLCGWLISQCLVLVVDVSACLDCCRLAAVTLTGVISGFHRMLDADLFLAPRETLVKMSKIRNSKFEVVLF